MSTNMAQMSDIHGLFEDLFKANMRQSLYELEHILAEFEDMPKSNRKDDRLLHATLRRLIGDAIANNEKHLADLRQRYETLK